jgi:hypothetical protein
MFAFKFDSIIYKLFKDRWKIEQEEILSTFTLPKTYQKVFNDENSQSELIVYKYPSHYKHKAIFQYNFGISLYFYSIGSIFAIKGFRDLLKKQSKLSFGILSLFSLISFNEGYLLYNRIRDVESVSIRNGRTLLIKTFQEEGVTYQVDVKDFRVINKNLEQVLILIDINQAKARAFKFFFIEPSPGRIYNEDLFKAVFFDHRIIKY